MCKALNGWGVKGWGLKWVEFKGWGLKMGGIKWELKGRGLNRWG